MRTRWKVLSSILAAIMILSSFTFIVAADSDLEKEGTVYTDSPNPQIAYNYRLYSNGNLNIDCYYPKINLSKLDDSVLFNAYQIIFDVSNVPYQTGYWLYVGGDDCKTGILNFVSDHEINFMTIGISDFPCADDISFSDGITALTASCTDVGVTSLDSFDTINAGLLQLMYCSEIHKVEPPSSVRTLEVDRCEYVDEIIMPEGIVNVELAGLPKLKSADFSNVTGSLYVYDCGMEEITIPNSERAIIMSSALTKATITPGREYINGGMFRGCDNLSDVTIPDSVTNVMYTSFKNCSSLKSITLPSSVKYIGEEAFYGSGLESFTIPSGVKTIEKEVFAFCSNLKSVTIPTSIECIDASAFLGCTALKDVYYEGTEAQWNKIVFDPENESASSVFNNATIHFNSEIPTGWVKVDGSWHLFDSEGNMLTGWQQDGGKWYYLGENGDMRIGWQNYGDKWYYLDPDSGAMKTGWLKSDGKWYYLDDSGAMVTGWLDDNGLWYFFNNSGSMVTGWKSVNGKWYYFEPSGAMKTGWLNDNGTWYFFKSNGSMAAGEYCEGYWINEDGTWTYPYKFKWEKNSKGWYYIASNGWYVKNDTVTIDDVSYSFDAGGYLIE